MEFGTPQKAKKREKRKWGFDKRNKRVQQRV